MTELAVSQMTNDYVDDGWIYAALLLVVGNAGMILGQRVRWGGGARQ